MFELVLSTLQAALPRRDGAVGLIVHSDQGWQYKMRPYRAMLTHHGVTQSMSRKGDCYDNAAIESFFGTLKAEFFHLAKFDNVAQLGAGVHDYIEYYNRERSNSGCKVSARWHTGSEVPHDQRDRKRPTSGGQFSFEEAPTFEKMES